MVILPYHYYLGYRVLLILLILLPTLRGLGPHVIPTINKVRRGG